ncbi:hypothetical protein AB0K02_24405 [Streptomyces sp. NPDC049597]|uniref:hypothetical protein n=1 Tax=Streptomyces sp. NPDC049597 TaxID=3155276 RepID=UPI00341927E4
MAVRLPDGRTALSQTWSAPLAAQVPAHLETTEPAGRGRTTGGDFSVATTGDLVVEARAPLAMRLSP